MTGEGKRKSTESKPAGKQEKPKAAPKEPAAGTIVGEPPAGKTKTRTETPRKPGSIAEEQAKTADAVLVEVTKHADADMTPLAMFMEIATRTENLVEGKLAQLARADEQTGARRSLPRSGTMVAHADRLTPKERAAAGVRDYADRKTNRIYKYDTLGRLIDFTDSSGRNTRIEYDGASQQPCELWVEQRSVSRVILHAQKREQWDIVVDQKTGDVKLSSSDVERVVESGLVVERETRVEHQISADGMRTIIIFDKDGHRLKKDVVLDGTNGQEYKLSHLDYFYEPSEGRADDAAPARSIQVDATGRRVQECEFKTALDVSRGRPSSRTDFSYGQSGDALTELRRQYDLTEGKPRSTLDVHKSVSLVSGETCIVSREYSCGQMAAEQEIKFDASGHPVSLKHREPARNVDLVYTLEEGRAVSVVDVHEKLSKQESQTFLSVGDQIIQTAYRNFDIVVARPELDYDPTLPRQGSDAHGTLVWRDADGGGYVQARVEKGRLHDSKGRIIGRFKDSGDVTLSGQPARKFNIVIDSTASGAFHGVGSDKERLDLCFNEGAAAAERREGFNGILAADNKAYKIVGGNVYDEAENFVGHIDSQGRIEFDQHRVPAQETKDINSFFDSGWRFTGNENGKSRSFDVGPAMSNGKIFLPAVDPVTGKPAFDGGGSPQPAVEFEVRLGMIINPSTGSQFGRLIPPKESRDSFEGGFIIVGASAAALPLAEFSGAVFDIALIGQSGMPGRRITGMSTGPLYSDSWRSGGLLNLQYVLDVHRENAARAAQAWRLQDQQTRWYSLITAGAADREKALELRTASELAQGRLREVAAEVESILTTGRAEHALFRDLDISKSEQEQVSPKHLEAPELTAENVGKLQGTMRLGIDQFDIQQGRLYRVRVEDGARRTEPHTCGALTAKYQISIDGKHIGLQSESRVLLKLKFDGNPQEQQVIGFGPARIIESGAFVYGGLVSANELLREAKQAESESLKGNLDYFRGKSALLASGFDGLTGNRGQMLVNLQERMSNQRNTLEAALEPLFSQGFSESPMDNNQIDNAVRIVQMFMHEMNLSSGDERPRPVDRAPLAKPVAETAPAGAPAGEVVPAAGDVRPAVGVTDREPATLEASPPQKRAKGLADKARVRPSGEVKTPARAMAEEPEAKMPSDVGAETPPAVQMEELPAELPPPVQMEELPAELPPPVQMEELPAEPPPTVQMEELPAELPPPATMPGLQWSFFGTSGATTSETQLSAQLEQIAAGVPAQPRREGALAEASRPADDTSFKIEHGTIRELPDGTVEVQAPAGGRYVRRDGRLIQVTDASGNTQSLFYDTEGRLTRVEYVKGRVRENWSQAGPDEWTVNDGTAESKCVGRFDIGDDGSVSFEHVNGTQTAVRPDGSSCIRSAEGRETLYELNYDAELSKFNYALDRIVQDADQRARMRANLDFFNERGIAGGMALVERAAVMHHVCEMLFAHGALPTTPSERLLLAEQILFQSAFPTGSDPSQKCTCDVATGEGILYTHNPASVAALVKSVALSGGYTDAADNRVGYYRPGDWTGTEPVGGEPAGVGPDGGRNRTYASEIYQKIAANLKWCNEEQAPDGTYIGAGNIRYDGRYLVDIRTNPPTRLFTDDQTREVEKPCIGATDLRRIAELISGSPQREFVIINNSAPDSRNIDPNNVVDSAARLAAVLQAMKDEEKLPAVVQVHTLNEPFWSACGYVDPASSAGDHLVNILGFEVKVDPDDTRSVEQIMRWPRPDDLLVRIDNQWGKGQDHSLSLVPLHELYEAMLEPGDPARITAIETRIATSPGDLLLRLDALRYRHEAGKQLADARALLAWAQSEQAGAQWETMDPVQSARLQRARDTVAVALDHADYRNQFNLLLAEAKGKWQRLPADRKDEIARFQAMQKFNKVAELVKEAPPFLPVPPPPLDDVVPPAAPDKPSQAVMFSHQMLPSGDTKLKDPIFGMGIGSGTSFDTGPAWSEGTADTIFDRVSALVDEYVNTPDDLLRFNDCVSTLRERADVLGISPFRVSATLEHVARLLEPGAIDSTSMLSHPERVYLAEHLMHLLAHPHAIDQGRNYACNVSALEVRTATLYPEAYARLVADVAITGKFTSADSEPSTVDMTNVRGVIMAGSEVVLADHAEMKPGHPSQIFHMTASNIHWQVSGVGPDGKTLWKRFFSGDDASGAGSDTVLYEMVPPVAPGDTGERLVRYSQGARQELEREPKLLASDLQGIMNKITGRQDASFAFAHEDSVQSSALWHSKVTPFANSQEMQDLLFEAKRNQQLPVMVMVHTSHEPFRTNFGITEAGGLGGWQVIGVTDIKTVTYTDESVETLIFLENSCGKSMECNVLRPEQLYDATIEPKES